MKISIVTIVKDDLSGFIRTSASIKSVLSDLRVEWVVVDSSGDDSIRRNVALERVNYLWQKPSGIYSAMCLGVEKAAGMWIHFLNAGDALNDPTFYESADEDGSYVIKAAARFVGPAGSYIRYARASWPWIFHGVTANQQAVLYPRVAALEVTRFKHLRVCGDYGLEAYLYLAGWRFIRIKVVAVNFYLGGVSSLQKSLVDVEAAWIQHSILRASRLTIFCSRCLRMLTSWVVTLRA